MPAELKPCTDMPRDGDDAVAALFNAEVLDKLRFEIRRDVIFRGTGLQHRQKRSCQALVFVTRSVRSNTDGIPLTQECVQFGRTLPNLWFTKRHSNGGLDSLTLITAFDRKTRHIRRRP